VGDDFCSICKVKKIFYHNQREILLEDEFVRDAAAENVTAKVLRIGKSREK
jgi:hypothetical protein